MSLINNIKEFREIVGMSQTQFSKKYGLDQSTWSKIERGKANLTDTYIHRIMNNSVTLEPFTMNKGRVKISNSVLREYRITNKLTMKSIAERIGVPLSKYKNFEKNGRTLTPEVFRNVVNILDIPLVRLLG